jgi:hypothetical protein
MRPAAFRMRWPFHLFVTLSLLAPISPVLVNADFI